MDVCFILGTRKIGVKNGYPLKLSVRMTTAMQPSLCFFGKAKFAHSRDLSSLFDFWNDVTRRDAISQVAEKAEEEVTPATPPFPLPPAYPGTRHIRARARARTHTNSCPIPRTFLCVFPVGLKV